MALYEVEKAEVVAEVGHVDGLVGVEHPVEVVGVAAVERFLGAGEGAVVVIDS